MALVIVSGLACSGRTARTTELIEEFQRRIAQPLPTTSKATRNGSETARTKLRLVHLQNSDANVSRAAFSTQAMEKPSRAAYLSLVMRHLARDAIVFADGGAGTNIKGFRYQLYCAAREVGVRCVSVLCVARPEDCKARNRARLTSAESEAYDEKVLDELLMRFEEPNAMTRWDSPLFVLDCSDQKGHVNGNSAETNGSHGGTSTGWEAAPLDAIWAAVTTGQVNKAPDVVAPTRGTSGNYLSMLEATTQLVLSTLQSLASTGVISDVGGQVLLPLPLATSDTGKSSTTQIPLLLPAGKGPPSTATLQRLRRQFVKMHASGAAAQNEISLVMGEEGGRARRSRTAGNGEAGAEDDHVAAGAGSSRAERKVKQFERQEKRQIDARRQQHFSAESDDSVRAPEHVIARRFAAYLEETL